MHEQASTGKGFPLCLRKINPYELAFSYFHFLGLSPEAFPAFQYYTQQKSIEKLGGPGDEANHFPLSRLFFHVIILI